ncbi:uncharacterized protein [Bemisia tabaci]|uniref:uncharacterized protein n=1 Tax=Bemisia tabaci TaxID=7038 RepID=UPI003B27C548
MLMAFQLPYPPQHPRGNRAPPLRFYGAMIPRKYLTFSYPPLRRRLAFSSGSRLHDIGRIMCLRLIPSLPIRERALFDVAEDHGIGGSYMFVGSMKNIHRPYNIAVYDIMGNNLLSPLNDTPVQFEIILPVTYEALNNSWRVLAVYVTKIRQVYSRYLRSLASDAVILIHVDDLVLSEDSQSEVHPSVGMSILQAFLSMTSTRSHSSKRIIFVFKRQGEYLD